MRHQTCGRVFLLAIFLFSALLVVASPVFAQETEITITIPFPIAEVEDAGSPNSPEVNVIELVNKGAGGMLQQVVPQAMVESAYAEPVSEEVESTTGVEEEEDAAEEEERAKEEDLHLLGAIFSFEHYSNDLKEQKGDVYGLSAIYDKDSSPYKYGFIFNYRCSDIDVGEDFSYVENLITGVLYGGHQVLYEPVHVTVGGIAQVSYVVNDKDIEDYSSLGGGAYLSLGKDFDFVEISTGATYLYTKVDVNVENNYSHLISYGFNFGIPIGQKYALNIYFMDIRNVADYKQFEPEDMNFFSFGSELIVSVAGSWVVSGGYRTVLDYKDYSSHMGYLGTMTRF